jgi:hypothetical protein
LANNAGMRPLLRALTAALLVAGLAVPPASARPSSTREVAVGGVRATITEDAVTLGNAVVERVWRTAPFETAPITDRGSGLSGASPDFACSWPTGWS